ncbi:MAG: hypothetical protein DWB93_00100 [Candidatus Poseidoniales archaeon]|nr:MAG: hypothetical protein DWB93_00100 [Candidatus Poseidoniales archaeon]
MPSGIIMTYTIKVSTKIQPHEDAEKVIFSIKNIFPDWKPNKNIKKELFPTKRETIEVSGNSESIDIFMQSVTSQRILDTAFDAMTMNINVNNTSFSISRQAAIKGRVSFVIDEKPLGGIMDIEIERENLEIWLEDETWHPGREEIPRQVKDDLAMNRRGEPVEWFDKFGNPTISTSKEEE